MSELMDTEAFRAAVKDGRPGGPVQKFTVGDPAVVDDATRTVRWVMSDGTVDRAGDTIDPNGWDLTNFKTNPIVLWSHDASQPPIGMAKNVRVAKGQLVGDVTFAPAETYEFADTIYRLVQGGYLRAGSVGFQPIEWEFAKEKGRQGAVDFRKQVLLEYSICGIPCNPNALAQAKAAGINTAPIIQWAEKILDGGDKILVPRSQLEELCKAADTQHKYQVILPVSEDDDASPTVTIRVDSFEDLQSTLTEIATKSFSTKAVKADQPEDEQKVAPIERPQNVTKDYWEVSQFAQIMGSLDSFCEYCGPELGESVNSDLAEMRSAGKRALSAMVAGQDDMEEKSADDMAQPKDVGSDAATEPSEEPTEAQEVKAAPTLPPKVSRTGPKRFLRRSAAEVRLLQLRTEVRT